MNNGPARRYDRVIWDWNGTLFDDMNANLTAVNRMLAQRNMPAITAEKYLEMVEIPIAGFYRKMGFDLDKEDFADLSVEFGDHYVSQLDNVGVMRSAREVLETVRDCGIRQIIISSFHQDSLRLLADKYGLTQYFEEILGKDDLLGDRKDDVARAWLARTNADPGRTVLFGDMTHDFEVAGAIGCDCALIPKGYNTKAALESCGVPVLGDISEVPAFLGLNNLIGEIDK